MTGKVDDICVFHGGQHGFRSGIVLYVDCEDKSGCLPNHIDLSPDTWKLLLVGRSRHGDDGD